MLTFGASQISDLHYGFFQPKFIFTFNISQPMYLSDI